MSVITISYRVFSLPWNPLCSAYSFLPSTPPLAVIDLFTVSIVLSFIIYIFLKRPISYSHLRIWCESYCNRGKPVVLCKDQGRSPHSLGGLSRRKSLRRCDQRSSLRCGGGSREQQVAQLVAAKGAEETPSTTLPTKPLSSPHMRCTPSHSVFATAVAWPLQQTSPFSLKSSSNALSSEMFSPILLPSPARTSHVSLVLLQHSVHTSVNASIIRTMISCYTSVSQWNSEDRKISFRHF